MNEKQQHEIDELISLLIDGEQTERQKTELKRLIRHDSTVRERLHALYRQKKLLNSIPVEKAPVSLVEDVTAALERKHILETFDQGTQAVKGTRHLLIRRVLTTAAMLLLPLGLLAGVVFQIIKPPSMPQEAAPEPLVVDSAAPADRPEPAVIREMPFDGILTFQTNQHITVSNFVEKKIFDLGLITATLPNRTADMTTYQVTTSPQKVSELVESLRSLWPRCSEISLAVMPGTEGDVFEVPDVRTDQIKQLAVQGSVRTLTELAQQYKASNAEQHTQLATGPEGLQGQTPESSYPDPGIPMLTGRDHPAPLLAEYAQPTVRLRIHIKRKMD